MLLTGGEIVAEYLIREGVPYAVGVPGHGVLGLVDALRRRQDRIGAIQVRHEQSAVHLADGYFRASGQPLAVFTSIGPGAVNTAEGLATSYTDSIPVLVVTSGVHTNMMGRGVLQELERQRWADFSTMMRPLCKRVWEVPRVDLLPRVLANAFNVMLTGRPGPVLIDLPMDVQAGSADVELPEPMSRRPAARPSGDAGAIQQAAALLAKAERPVIFAGGGVLLSRAATELRQLAEKVGAAVVTTMTGKGAFPEDHPLYGWLTGVGGTPCGIELTCQAAVLLAVGVRFEDETCSSYVPGRAFAIPPTKLVHVDIDPFEIGKNYPVAVGIVGDAKAVLAGLRDAVPPGADYRDTPYYAEIQRLRTEWLAQQEAHCTTDLDPVTMPQFFWELRRFLDPNALLVTGAGTPPGHMMQCFTFTEPGTNITSGFSTMGYPLPAAIGAKLAAPERQVVAAVGDGDFMMTMQELAVAAQYEVPILVCVLNNMGWDSIRRLQRDYYGADKTYFTEFHDAQGQVYSPDFAHIAQGFGIWSERVTRPDEIAPALARWQGSGQPGLLEVRVNREDRPETGFVSTPAWWDVPVPTYLREKREAYEAIQQQETDL